MDISNLLLSDKDFRQKSYDNPYCYKISNKSQSLFYFGGNHSHDPSNKQFEVLKEMWSDFKTITNSDNSIVLVEGGMGDGSVEEDEARSIINGSEHSLTHFLSKNDGYNTVSPEPTIFELRQRVEKLYSRDEIEYQWFANYTHQWNRFRKEDQPDFNEHINRYLEQDKKETGWKDYDFSINHMIEIHKKLFKTDFNKTDVNFFYSIINPHLDTCIINEVSRAESNIRDVYLVEAILKYWNQRLNIFISFGSGHAVVQEPALLKLLVENNNLV